MIDQTRAMGFKARGNEQAPFQAKDETPSTYGRPRSFPHHSDNVQSISTACLGATS